MPGVKPLVAVERVQVVAVLAVPGADESIRADLQAAGAVGFAIEIDAGDRAGAAGFRNAAGGEKGGFIHGDDVGVGDKGADGGRAGGGDGESGGGDGAGVAVGIGGDGVIGVRAGGKAGGGGGDKCRGAAGGAGRRRAYRRLDLQAGGAVGIRGRS